MWMRLSMIFLFMITKRVLCLFRFGVSVFETDIVSVCSLLRLEELAGLELQVECHLALERGEPLGVACLKGAVFLLVRGERLEGGAAVAFLVLLQVGQRVLSHEAAEQVQLEVVLGVESLATLSLQECVIVVFVALVSQHGHQLLLALQSQFGQNSFFEVHLHPLDSVLHLQDGPGLEGPGRCGGLEGVERLSLLLLEKL